MPYETIARTMLTTMISNMIKAMSAYNMTINAGDHAGANYYMHRARFVSNMLTDSGFKHSIEYKTMRAGTNDYKIFASVTFTSNETILNQLGIALQFSNRPNSITHDFKT